MDTILSGLGYGAAYTALGLALLAVGYWVLDLLTPGHLGTHLSGTTTSGDGTVSRVPSYGAAVVGAAWMVAQATIVFTAIWTNGTSAFGLAVTATALFGLMGVLLLAATFKVLDLLTPGALGEVVCVPGPARPLAYLTAASIVATAAVVCASIA